MCRYCHDEYETHFFNRKTVTELVCTECDTRQRVQAECEKCGVRFGRVSRLVIPTLKKSGFYSENSLFFLLYPVHLLGV